VEVAEARPNDAGHAVHAAHSYFLQERPSNPATPRMQQTSENSHRSSWRCRSQLRRGTDRRFSSRERRLSPAQRPAT
jgi:hypothetical protein